MMCRRSS
ncbi:hypothetical protein MTR67_046736 [Solanum verrucosum]|nr:hypothetical protein MTR67_046736 [Solanum verrucosum]